MRNLYTAFSSATANVIFHISLRNCLQCTRCHQFYQLLWFSFIFIFTFKVKKVYSSRYSHKNKKSVAIDPSNIMYWMAQALYFFLFLQKRSSLFPVLQRKVWNDFLICTSVLLRPIYLIFHTFIYFFFVTANKCILNKLTIQTFGDLSFKALKSMK